MQTSNISKIYIQDDEPSNPIPNRIWLDTTSQTLKRYNFSTKTWVNINISSDDIPTKVSDLTNDSGYQTSSQVNSTVNSALTSYSTTSAINTLLADKADKVVETANSTSTSIAVDVVENTAYKYGTLTALKINSVEDSVVESMIFFTSGNTATAFTYPSSLNVIGTISIEANTSYAISILNNIMIIGAIS